MPSFKLNGNLFVAMLHTLYMYMIGFLYSLKSLDLVCMKELDKKVGVSYLDIVLLATLTILHVPYLIMSCQNKGCNQKVCGTCVLPYKRKYWRRVYFGNLAN